MHKMLKEIQELNEYFEARTPDSLKECEDKINNSKGGGFLGYIPDFMLEKIPSDKSEVDFFKMFNNFVLLLKKSKIQQAEQLINMFFNNKMLFNVELIEDKDATYMRYGAIIKNNINDNKLFIKIFKKNYKKGQMFHYRHGPYIESAVALFINYHLKNSPYFAKFYFANPTESYMVTEFVEQILKLTKEDFIEMNIKDNDNVIEKDENATKLFEKYTGEKYSHYQALKALKGGCFRFLDYRAGNFFIYEDKNNKKHVKMIDFGWCISYNPELRTK